ncbi:MAG TPA: peptidylprolyl isomerase [Acidimicrobiales bacterium]|nr:peptidylprolyl isomerase [Acidimicrobiales bacterium]
MPSDKRARKRANRNARLAELERQRRRRTTSRRGITAVVLIAVAVGAYALVSSGGKNTSAHKASTTTTSSATTTTTGTPPSTTTTVSLTGDTTAANCPSSLTAPLKKPTFSSKPLLIIYPQRTYSAVVKTDVGSFTIDLDTQAAPHTVNNFVFLADNHFYDCVVFHRVIPGFMDQTGDPTGTGTGGPGYTFADENIPTGGYTAGDVAMANSGPNTNGSQFFILVAPYSNDQYSLFGHVSSGMDVVQKINADGNASDNGTPPKKYHRIISVTIIGLTG